MVPWHWSHFTPEVHTCILTSLTNFLVCFHAARKTHFQQVFRNFARSALRDVDVLGDSFRYDPTRFGRTFCGGIVTIVCILAAFGIIAASSYQFHLSPRVYMPAQRAIVINSIAFEKTLGSNTSTRVALSDICDLPPLMYTLRLSMAHFETTPTQIRRVTVTDLRKYGLRTDNSDIVFSSSDKPSAPNIALATEVVVPLGAFNDLVQASSLDVSFSVANALGSKASRSVDSQVSTGYELQYIPKAFTLSPGSRAFCRFNQRVVRCSQRFIALVFSKLHAEGIAVVPAASCYGQHWGAYDKSGRGEGCSRN